MFRSEGDDEKALDHHVASSDSDSVFGSDVRHVDHLSSLFTRKSSPTVVTLDAYGEVAKALGLPQNPKYWSPTNLSLYLGTVLATKRGGPLSDGVLRDVQIYIIREKITGRHFMRLSEEDMAR